MTYVNHAIPESAPAPVSTPHLLVRGARRHFDSGRWGGPQQPRASSFDRHSGRCSGDPAGIRLVAVQVEKRNHRESERSRHAPTVYAVDQAGKFSARFAVHDDRRPRRLVADARKNLESLPLSAFGPGAWRTHLTFV